MTEKLRPSDFRLILICLLVCAAGLFIGIRYYYRAFPEASIDFKYDKSGSELLAEQFLAAQTLPTGGYRHAASFRYDDDAKVFMERELGLKKTNQLVSGEIKLWRWGHRWFKPLQKEELRVEVTPGGKIASFLHVLPEEAAGASLPAVAARAMAESFLVLEMRRPIDSLEFIDSQSEKRPHRTDYVFTWKVADLNLRGASYRIAVTVQGDRVDGYSEFLNVPEEWMRSYARLRSLNDTTAQADLVFFALLGVAMLVTLGRRIRMKDIRWKTGLMFGTIACVLQFLASLNEFPLAEYGFDNTGSFGSFIAQSILGSALGAMSFGGIILLLTVCAEPLYRQAYPAHLSISRMFSWRAIRTRTFFLATIVGITLTFFFFAYEIGFYLLADKLGAWAPAEIPYSDILNTRFPFVFVLLAGFFPAVSEEWMFRAFSIPYLHRLFKHRWLAVLLAAFIWGFGHANYPNQPFYIRGVEVGIVGIIMGWVMIRFGILATLITHYSIDAFYSAFLFLRSGNPYLVISGAATAGINLIPLALAAGAYIATRHFHTETELNNQSEGSPPELLPAAGKTESPVIPYTPLNRKSAPIALAMIMAGAALVILLRAPHFGDKVRFRLTARQAASSATQFLSQQLSFDLNGYRRAAQPVNRVEPMPAQYIYTAGGIHGLNSMYGAQIIPLAWQVRYFRPLQKDEFRVSVDPGNGQAVAFRHSLPEGAPGADLPVDTARHMAASFLAGRGYDLKQFDLEETRSEKPRQRRDSEFVWEAQSGTPGVISDARLRVEARVYGNKIGFWTQYVKIPEQWIRNRERRSSYSIGALALRTVFFITAACFVIMALIRGTRQSSVRWRMALKVAGWAMLLQLVHIVNSIPGLMFQYNTQTEMGVFVLSALADALVELLGLGLAAGLSAALIMACYPDTPALFRRANRMHWARDAVIAALAALGVAIILQWITSQIEYYAAPLALAPGISLPDNLGTYLPSLSTIRDVLLSALFFSAVLAFSIDLWRRFAGRPIWRLLLLAGLLGSFLPPSARRISEVGFGLLPSVLFVAVACLLVIYFLRNNYLAYFLSAAVVSLARASLPLTVQGNTLLAIQGCLLWALLLGGMIWLWRQHQPEANQGLAQE